MKKWNCFLMLLVGLGLVLGGFLGCTLNYTAVNLEQKGEITGEAADKAVAAGQPIPNIYQHMSADAAQLKKSVNQKADGKANIPIDISNPVSAAKELAGVSSSSDKKNQMGTTPGPTTEVKTKPEVQSQPVEAGYETIFDHTTTASIDGGKSLCLCLGQDIKFDNCTSSGVAIPLHPQLDEGRALYWNMHEAPVGDIVCKKGDKTFRYKADAEMVNGNCGG